MTGEHAGKRLLITGAASGIGRATAVLAMARGARVTALVRDADEAAATAADLPDLPADRVVACDLADAGKTASILAQAIAAEGGIDGLAHCAGIYDHRAALETDIGDWNRMIAVNLTAGFVLARAAAAAMVEAGAEAGAGSIVLVSSQIGLVGHPRAAAYAAAKSGVNGLVRALAIELAPRGVRANAVAPGPIATPMTAIARDDPMRREALIAGVPLGRFGESAEVAEAILFLLGDRASFITGHVLCVDGGYTAR
ncbi:MAG: SDR family NAD(P)-dependent oxidoreductase [Azospirillaceae bacterium]